MRDRALDNLGDVQPRAQRRGRLAGVDARIASAGALGDSCISPRSSASSIALLCFHVLSSSLRPLIARARLPLPAARPRAARASVKMELIMPEKDFLIAPSILSADFAKLGAEVDASLAAGADVVHFDVMDNHYVPNLTIGPMVCSALRKHGVTAPIDVHLMVSPVDRIVQDFADAGASYITFHPEASPHV